MDPSPILIDDTATWDEQRAELGRLLELAEPVPDAVLRRALADQRFAYYLLSFRGRKDMLERFFRAPATEAYEQRPTARQSSRELAGNAARALARWGKSGFALASSEVYERRLTACLGCDQLSAPPRSLLSRITAPSAADRAEGRVCGACGCPVTRKASLPSESCPLPDPTDPAHTRWGEQSHQGSH